MSFVVCPGRFAHSNATWLARGKGHSTSKSIHFYKDPACTTSTNNQVTCYQSVVILQSPSLTQRRSQKKNIKTNESRTKLQPFGKNHLFVKQKNQPSGLWWITKWYDQPIIHNENDNSIEVDPYSHIWLENHTSMFWMGESNSRIVGAQHKHTKTQKHDSLQKNVAVCLFPFPETGVLSSMFNTVASSKRIAAVEYIPTTRLQNLPCNSGGIASSMRT